MKELLLKQTEPTIGIIYSMKVNDAEDDDGKGKPNLKTIWGKFNVQIQDLMDELAEPLIPQDLGDEEEKKPDPKKKVVEPTCDPTDLHFIRCLKPNDFKIKDYFSDAMTL
jgi:myosin heavy subunit